MARLQGVTSFLKDWPSFSQQLSNAQSSSARGDSCVLLSADRTCCLGGASAGGVQAATHPLKFIGLFMPGKQCPGSYPTPLALAVFLPFSSTKIFESWGELSTKFKNKIYVQYFLSAFLPSFFSSCRSSMYLGIHPYTYLFSLLYSSPSSFSSFLFLPIKRRLLPLPLPSPCNHCMSSVSSERPLPLCFLGSYYPKPW